MYIFVRYQLFCVSKKKKGEISIPNYLYDLLFEMIRIVSEGRHHCTKVIVHEYV